MEVWVTCDSCGCKTFFRGRDPTAELRVLHVRSRVIDKLGPNGAFVCPRCGTLVFVCIGDKPIAGAARFQRAEAARRIGKATKGLRFAVGEPAGARSSVWRVWMNHRRDDVYISARALASELKVSLHPEFWYFGFTKQHADRGLSLLPSGADRRMSIWDRPAEFGAGWTRAFPIVVPGSEVIEAPTPYPGSEAVWFPYLGPRMAMQFISTSSSRSRARLAVGGDTQTPMASSNRPSFLTRLDMSTGGDSR